MAQSSPTVQYADIFSFSGDVPFIWTNDQKFAAALQSSATVNLDNYKLNHEVLCGEIYFNGPFTNPGPISITLTWTRKSDNKQVFTGTYSIPTPESQGFEWWNWYKIRAWIGKIDYEVNGPGQYECKITAASGFGFSHSAAPVMTVTGAPIVPEGKTTIHFVVKKAGTSTPISGASIFNLQTGMLTTNVNGMADVLVDRNYIYFTVSKEGYNQKEISVNLLGYTQNDISVSVSLDPSITPPPPPSAAHYKVDSNVQQFSAYLDGVLKATTFNGTMEFDVTVGSHTIKLTADGMQDSVATHNFTAGETWPNASVVFQELPPPPPPLDPFAQLLQWLGITLSQYLSWFSSWLTAAESEIASKLTYIYDKIHAQGEEEFGPEELDGHRQTLKESALEMSLGLIMIGPVIKAVPVAAQIVGKQLIELGAEEFLARAIKNPAEILQSIKSLSAEELTRFYKSIGDPIIKRDVIQTVDRLLLDEAERNMPLVQRFISALPKPQYLFFAAIGVLGLASWASLDNLSFALTGGIRELIDQKQYQRALDSIANARTGIGVFYNNVVWRTMADIFLAGTWSATYSAILVQLDDWEIIAKAGLEEEGEGTTISISTNVDPAFVEIGQWVSAATPVDKLKIPAGTYDVTAQKEGYTPKTKSVIVKPGQDNPVDFILEEITEPIPSSSGRLEVVIRDYKTNSLVAATLFIDGHAEAYHLASYVLDLLPDTYELEVSQAGYETYSDTVVIDKGQTTKVTVLLVKIEIIEPPLPGVTCETYGYLSKPGEPSANYEAVPVRGMICYKLKAIETGRVEVSCTPVASVSIAGAVVLDKTPGVLELVQGTYELLFHAEDYVDKTSTAYVKAGERTVISISLKAVEAPVEKKKLWRLDVNSSPSSAKILVNYSFTGKYTPDYVLLNPGEYVVTLTKSGYQKWETPIKLEEI